MDDLPSKEDPNQYVSVELSNSGAIVTIKRKRLIRDEIWSKLGSKTKHDERKSNDDKEKEDL